MKYLTIILVIICLVACGNQRKQNNTTPEAQTIATEQSQQEADKIPHIFHGMTKSISVGEIGANGEIVGFSEHKLYAVKYALYLDQGIIAIFDDNNQQHLIVQYIGSEDADGDTCYLFATSDQNKEQGYVEINYTSDGRVLLIVDYPKYAMGYFLDTYMSEEEFAEHLSERYKR
jgi:hypothetical protein